MFLGTPRRVDTRHHNGHMVRLDLVQDLGGIYVAWSRQYPRRGHPVGLGPADDGAAHLPGCHRVYRAVSGLAQMNFRKWWLICFRFTLTSIYVIVSFPLLIKSVRDQGGSQIVINRLHYHRTLTKYRVGRVRQHPARLELTADGRAYDLHRVFHGEPAALYGANGLTPGRVCRRVHAAPRHCA